MNILTLLAFLVAIAIMMGLPILVGRYMRRKFKLPWSIFFWGMAGFLLVQVIHYPLVVFTQNPLERSLAEGLGAAGALIAFAVVLGLLAGAFESAGKYLVMKRKGKRWHLDVRKVLFFGAGWGAIESMIIGCLLLTTMISYVTVASMSDEQLSDLRETANGSLTGKELRSFDEQIEALRALTPLDLAPAPLERMAAFTAQIALTLLAGLAILKGRWIFLGAAIAAHAALDAGGVYLSSTLGIWAAEVFVTAFALVSLYYIRTQWPKGEPFPQVPDAEALT